MDVVPGTPGAGGHRPPSPMLPRNPTRVLAVVGDAANRNALERLLRRLAYVATTCSHPAAAMAVLRERNGEFDAVLVDMFAPRDAVLELLERVHTEMRIPVYVISMCGIDKKVRAHGPLTTPIGMEEFETYLQFVVNRMSHESRSQVASPDGESNDGPASTITTLSSSGSRATRRRNQERETTNQEVEQNSVEMTNQAVEQNSMETMNQEDEQNSEDGEEQQQLALRPRKERLVWTTELHSKFVDAHDRLITSGDAMPKKILELMNDPRLTRENVASHLQKYRLTLKQRESHVNWRANSSTRHQGDQPPQAHSIHERDVPPPQSAFITSNMSKQHECQAVQRSSNPQCDNSANIISQDEVNLLESTVTHQPPAAAGYMPTGNYGLNAQTMSKALIASGMQNHCPDLQIQASASEAVNMNTEHMVDPKVHVREQAMGRCMAQKDMHSIAQVGHESVAVPAVPSAPNLDGSSQEDLSKTVLQYLNNDSEPSWHHDFLHLLSD